jgi:hypothetical protein
MQQFDLEIDERSKANLLLAAHWAKNIAIGSYVIIGIVVLGSIFYGIKNSLFGNHFTNSQLGSVFENGILSVSLILFFAILCFVLIVYINLLLKFSKKVVSGINNNDITEITDGFRNLKSYFLITGILMILGLIADIFSFF